jgi:hypothetical protein
MSACSPQRFLANNRNLFRDAVIAASSVLPVANQVTRRDYLPAPRGTAQVSLTGTYTGSEPADYDIQILDTDVEVARVSAPTFAGAGSGTIDGIAATGPQQIFTIECANAGIPGTKAAVTIAGQPIRALVSGTSGNSIHIVVDQSTLAFADTAFSLLVDLRAGQGGAASPLIGAGFDWGQAQLDANGLIPVGAPRIAFGDDESTVHLPYKDFVDGEWKYYLIPALSRDVPKGTQIKAVTGGRTVAITNGIATDTFSDVETDYDLLYQIRTASTLVYVDGIVANDRSPTGQAAHELSLRTDAHAEVSTGSGSTYARGLTNVTVAAGAGTQLVTLTCFAVNSTDHPNASLGKTLWDANSSLRGALGTVQEGVAFTFADFGATIPVRLPPGYGAPKGRISATYQPTGRTGNETIPPVCFADMALGPNAVDGSYIFELTAKPSGDCDCRGMPVPPINPFCLGIPTEGGQSVSYQSDTVVRLQGLRLWFTNLCRELSSYGNDSNSAKEAPAIANPVDGLNSDYAATANEGQTLVTVNPDAGGGSSTWVAGVPGSLVSPMTPGDVLGYARSTESIKAIVDNFEGVLAQIDPLAPSSPPGYREAGNDAWDAGFAELQSDIASAAAASSPFTALLNIPSSRYDARLNYVLISAGISPLGKTDASTVSGDGCWRDTGAPLFWKAVGTDLMPMFTNSLYYASRPNGAGKVFSEHSFSILTNVKCAGALKIGDRIQVDINNASWGATYQVGDKLELPIVAASPLYLTGGVAGNTVQTWNVSGSVSGPFAAYPFDPSAPVAYSGSAGGATVAFLLHQGGIPFAHGDRFRFAVEGGHYRWRKNGGAWDGASPPLPIPLGADTIEEGLSVSFTAGAAASFTADDLYAFRARQPWAVSNTRTPGRPRWKWNPDVSPDTATYDADFGAPKPLTMFAMLHDVAEGATITLAGGLAAADEWTEAITWRAGTVWKALDRTARYVRVTIESAGDGSVQWLWIGEALTTTLSADFDPVLDFQISRPGGNLQGGRFVGEAISGDVSWTENALAESDVGWSVEAEDALVAMLKELKRADDEPLLFIPNVSRVDDPVVFARVASDQIQFPGRLARDASVARRFAATLPLVGVWQ